MEGSSAIPGLGGKGIIDMFISVKKRDLKKSIVILQDNGYIYKPNPKIKNREYFERHYVNKKNGNERRIHLHLNRHGSFDMRRAIAFRDYLIKNPKIAKEYSEIKKQAVKHAKGKGKKYREYKHKFLQKVGREAMRTIKYHTISL